MTWQARKFYDSVASELVQHSQTVDVFTCSLDQIGLAEMREIVSLTGGLVVQADTFHNPVFKDSMRRLFLKEGEEGFIGLTSNASLEVIPSKDVKVCGMLGPAARMEKKSPHISDTEVGLGGTTQWRLCGMDSDTTPAVIFEIAGKDSK